MNEREFIEYRWLKYLESDGRALCGFFKWNCQSKLDKSWQIVWDGECGYIGENFITFDNDSYDRQVLTYLTRALSLHMLLDDNDVV
jgi:hypothetical protein